MILTPKLLRILTLGIASALTISGTLLALLAVGTDNWRIKESTNATITQGLHKECIHTPETVICHHLRGRNSIQNFQEGFHVLAYCFIVSAAVTMALASLLSLAASCTQKSFLVVPVISLEFISGILLLTANSVYTHFLLGEGWRMSWSLILSWAGSFMLFIGFMIHLLSRDVKFFGKKMLTATIYWGPDIDNL